MTGWSKSAEDSEGASLDAEAGDSLKMEGVGSGRTHGPDEALLGSEAGREEERAGLRCRREGVLSGNCRSLLGYQHAEIVGATGVAANVRSNTFRRAQGGEQEQDGREMEGAETHLSQS